MRKRMENSVADRIYQTEKNKANVLKCSTIASHKGVRLDRLENKFVSKNVINL